MRIAWFTPFNVATAIGEFSKQVCCELAALADVELWTSDGPELHPTDYPSPDITRAPTSWRCSVAMTSSSTTSATTATTTPTSTRSQRRTRASQSCMIARSHHLFAELWLNGRDLNPPLYIERMGNYYGPDAAAIAEASLSGVRPPVWESGKEVLAYPLYEEAIANAFGVITHSEHTLTTYDAGGFAQLSRWTFLVTRMS